MLNFAVTPGHVRSTLTGRKKQILAGLALAVAMTFPGQDAAGVSSVVHVFHTDMVNTGLVPNARGRIDGTLTHQALASNQALKLTLTGLAPQTVYQLIAFIGDETSPRTVTDLTTDARGAFVVLYVQKCPGNLSPGGLPLPGVLDPITRIHQLDLIKDGSVVLTGVIGSDLRADCTAPAVSLTVPADSATGVATNQDIAASFTEPMNPASLTATTFTLKRGVTPVAGVITCSGTSATFNPVRDLLPGTVYTATLTTRVRDLAGNGLSTNVVWKFTTAPAPNGAKSVWIGYTNALAVTNYSQALMNQIGQLRWYFAHASVGDNMKQGIANLHQANPAYYQLQYVSATDVPPGTAQAGVIYEYMRGNPGWQVKVDSFEDYVTNGWRSPLVDVVMNKLCWIDQTADVDYYINSMTKLESAFPQTTFVYMTMPLDTTVSLDNYSRNIYNDTLRTSCRANNRILFDVADIEAHNASGGLVTFTYNSRVCQRLFDGYTSDGGHPNSVYAEQMLARGFYALAAALIARSGP